MNQAPEQRVLPTVVEIRGREARTIVGVAAPYGETTDVGPFTEEFSPGCFAKSITEAARNIPLLTQHDHKSLPVGRVERWEETTEGLVGHWRIDTRDEAMELARMVEEGLVGNLSVGFAPVKDDWAHDGPKPHVRRIESKLYEVSVVSVSQYDSSKITAIRSAGVPDLAATRIAPKPNLAQWQAYLSSIRSH